MAVLALALVGTAIGNSFGTVPIIAGLTAGAIGGTIGGVLGGVIDQQFLFPALFGKGNAGQSGPRINDFQVSSASEGTPMQWVTGGKTRVAGTIIWMGPVQEVKKTQSSGGKGGGGGASQKQVTYTYFADVAIAFAEGPISAYRRIWADNKLIYDNVTSEKVDLSTYETLVGYTGSEDQTADPTIEAVVGAGNTPAYRGTSYIVIKKMALLAFGNRVPNFSAYLEQDSEMGGQTLAVATSRVLNRADRVQNVDYDVDLLPGRVKGVQIAQIQSTVQTLESLILTYNLGVQEVDGKLIFFPYSSKAPIEIDNRDLAAHDQGQDTPEQLSITDNPGTDLPSEVVVNYFDVDNFFQTGSQRAKQINKVVISVDTVDVPVVLTATEAKTLATQLLWLAWSQRDTVQFNLPPSYLGRIHESDLIALNYEGTDFIFKLNELNQGANFLISCSGTIYDPDSLDQHVTASDLLDGSGGAVPDPAVYEPPQMLLIVGDLAPLIDEHVDHHGLYYGGAALDPTKEYRGAELYVSKNGGDDDDVDGLNLESTVGITTTTLGNVGDWHCWDYANTVDVQISQGTLVSVSADDVLSGKNWMLIGKEIVGFVTAALIATNKYRLSTLIRGRRNTQFHTSDHTSTDRCLLLDVTAVQTVNHMNNGDIGQSFAFSLPSNGMQVADVGSDGKQTVVYSAQMRTPFQPATVWGSRNTAGDLTISWIRCTRALTSFLVGDVPLAEEYERYILEIYSGATLKHTEDIYWEDSGDTTNFIYTAAAQVADGFSVFSSTITVKVYQVSKMVGKGQPLTVNL